MRMQVGIFHGSALGTPDCFIFCFFCSFDCLLRIFVYSRRPSAGKQLRCAYSLRSPTLTRQCALRAPRQLKVFWSLARLAGSNFAGLPGFPVAWLPGAELYLVALGEVFVTVDVCWWCGGTAPGVMGLAEVSRTARGVRYVREHVGGWPGTLTKSVSQ